MDNKKFKNLKIKINIVNIVFIIGIIISMLMLFMLITSIRTHAGINNLNSLICLGLFIISLGVIYLINFFYELNYKRINKLFLSLDDEISYSLRMKHKEKIDFKNLLNIKVSKLTLTSIIKGNISSVTFSRLGGTLDLGNGKKNVIIYLFNDLSDKEIIVNSTNVVLRKNNLPLLRKEKGYDIYSFNDIDENIVLKKSEPYILIHHNNNVILILLDEDKFKLKNIDSEETYLSFLVDEKKEIKSLIKNIKK